MYRIVILLWVIVLMSVPKRPAQMGSLLEATHFFGSLLAVGITGVERKKRAKGDDGGNAGYHRGFGTDQAEGYDILVVWIKCNQCGHSQVSAKTDG